MASPGMGAGEHPAEGGGAEGAMGQQPSGLALYEQSLQILNDVKQREEVRLKAAQELNEGLDAAIALSSAAAGQDHKKPGGFLHTVCQDWHVGTYSV